MTALNETERGWLKDLLDRLADSLSASGCNDYSVTITDESRAALLEMLTDGDDGDQSDAEWDADIAREAPAGSRYVTYDFMILAHLRKRLGVL